MKQESLSITTKHDDDDDLRNINLHAGSQQISVK